MDRLFKSILSIKEFKLRVDDDYVDRLSRQYGVILMITFAFIVSTKQFVGSPIACWCPAQFTTSHREYANNICWVSNTYYLPMDDAIPRDHATLVHNAPQKVSYYQWMPLMLMFQVIMALKNTKIIQMFSKNVDFLMKKGFLFEKLTILLKRNQRPIKY